MRSLKLFLVLMLSTTGCTALQSPFTPTQGNQLAQGGGARLIQEGGPGQTPVQVPVQEGDTRCAVIFYFHVRRGKLNEYNYYISRVAGTYEATAQQAGAFISSTTYFNPNRNGSWTHMRVFVVDSYNKGLMLTEQLKGAYQQLEPYPGRYRAERGYANTLRAPVASEIVAVL